MQILLSNSQAGPGRIVKQEQEEISRNHAQALFPGPVERKGGRVAKRDFSAKSGTPPMGLPYITFTQRARVRGGVQKVPQIGDAKYRWGNKGVFMVATNLFQILLNCSAWPCLGPA